MTQRVPIQIETQAAPPPTGETEEDSTPLGGSLSGDGDPPAAESFADGTGEIPVEPAPVESLALSSPEAASVPSTPVSAVASPAGGSRKETVGTLLLLAMLGLGSAAAGYKARSLLSFFLRGLRAGSALRS